MGGASFGEQWGEIEVGFIGKEVGKNGIELVEEGFLGSVIVGERDDLGIEKLLGEMGFDLGEELGLDASESVNGLFGVAYEEEICVKVTLGGVIVGELA